MAAQGLLSPQDPTLAMHSIVKLLVYDLIAWKELLRYYHNIYLFIYLLLDMNKFRCIISVYINIFYKSFLRIFILNLI